MIFRTRIVGLQRGAIIGYDDFGNPIYGPDVEVPFYGELRPLQGDELADGTRDFVTTRYRLYAPAGIDVTAYDKVRIGTLDYEVSGEAEPHNINGRPHHREVLVQRSTG